MVDRVSVKGREESMSIFELINETEETDEIILSQISKYEKTLHIYLTGDWQKANLCF